MANDPWKEWRELFQGLFEDGVAYGIGFLLLLGGALVLGLEILFWLWKGIWLGVPTAILFFWLQGSAFAGWVGNPVSWVGLQKIVVWIVNLPLFLSLAGLGIIIISLKVVSDSQFKLTHYRFEKMALPGY